MPELKASLIPRLLISAITSCLSLRSKAICSTALADAPILVVAAASDCPEDLSSARAASGTGSWLRVLQSLMRLRCVSISAARSLRSSINALIPVISYLTYVMLFLAFSGCVLQIIICGAYFYDEVSGVATGRLLARICPSTACVPASYRAACHDASSLSGVTFSPTQLTW